MALLCTPTEVIAAYRLRVGFDLRPIARDQTADSPVASIGPSLFTALQEQMGLRLESQKTRGEVLAIDSAEKASEN